MSFPPITQNVYPEGYARAVDLDEMARTLPADVPPRTWRETIYSWMALIHASVRSGPFSLNALALLYGDSSAELDLYLHTSGASLLAELGLKGLQQVPNESLVALSFVTLPLLIALMGATLAAEAAWQILDALASWAAPFTGPIQPKALAELIPPSVGRVEVKSV